MLVKTLRLALLLALAGATQAAPVPAVVAAAMQKANLPAEALGFVVLPLAGQGDALRYRAEVAMQPASTMKLLTTIVALDTLGTNYRGYTELLRDGEVRDGVLQGNLYLRGGADADLDWPALWQLLSNLREQGIRELRGDIVVDRHLFQPARLDVGVAPFDETPEFQYNVIPDALQLNGNLLAFSLQSDQSSLKVTIKPALDGIRVDSSAVQLTDHACKDWEDDWQLPDVHYGQQGEVSIRLRGGFPRQCRQETDLNLVERSLLASKMLTQLWQQLGGKLQGAVREGQTQAQAQVVARHESRPLAEVIREMNKESDNPLTRLVFLSLGARAGSAWQEATTLQRAQAQVRRWLSQQGIADDGLVLENGSGLSRLERIKPNQMAAALQAAYKGKQAAELMTSMPVAGVDGTMRRRLKDSPAAGWARIKTGTLNGVVAVAGYVPDLSGKPWVVSAMINQPGSDSDQTRAVLDTLIDWVARSGPTVEPVLKTKRDR